MCNGEWSEIHYVIGGKSEPLLLVHGFGQNWFMWNRLLPDLSKHFTIWIVQEQAEQVKKGLSEFFLSK